MKIQNTYQCTKNNTTEANQHTTFHNNAFACPPILYKDGGSDDEDDNDDFLFQNVVHSKEWATHTRARV